jgi:hypothetical protein
MLLRKPSSSGGMSDIVEEHRQYHRIAIDYDPRRYDNEEKSAALAGERCGRTWDEWPHMRGKRYRSGPSGEQGGGLAGSRPTCSPAQTNVWR